MVEWCEIRRHFANQLQQLLYFLAESTALRADYHGVICVASHRCRKQSMRVSRVSLARGSLGQAVAEATVLAALAGRASVASHIHRPITGHLKALRTQAPASGFADGSERSTP
ncbi:hypothetical protein PO002_28210 [Cupriavidus necator]|uniref:hypothetical protein n=1 Tax=Cupriavidus necator TaxID=106590 RepID=UPI0039C0B34C